MIMTKRELVELICEMADAYCEYKCSRFECDNCVLFSITNGELEGDGIYDRVCSQPHGVLLG